MKNIFGFVEMFSLSLIYQTSRKAQNNNQMTNIKTKQTIFLDFNPVDEANWVYDVADKDGNLLIHSTYKDNPFLPKEQVDQIEGLKDADSKSKTN